MSKRIQALVLCVLSLGLVACGSVEVQSKGGDPACQQYELQACACGDEDGLSGLQVCAANGTWKDCVCGQAHPVGVSCCVQSWQNDRFCVKATDAQDCEDMIGMVVEDCSAQCWHP